MSGLGHRPFMADEQTVFPEQLMQLVPAHSNAAFLQGLPQQKIQLLGP
ncbi:hypothetical protein [Pontibacter qinzhouensis]|nr:hypothetical protein [Pontibacter qinzhouensis]